MKILLHICCSVCTTGPFHELSDEGHEVTGYFYNPNIHPLIEYRRRLKSVKVLQERMPIKVIYDEAYGLTRFLEEVDWRSGERCRDCYRLRLGQTAEIAARQGVDAMTTTLLTSEHQAHEMVAEIGRRCAEERGIEFLYRDWRHMAEPNRGRAQDLGLYLQQYCGCIFSECDRYKDTGRHLYKGSGPIVGD